MENANAPAQANNANVQPGGDSIFSYVFRMITMYFMITSLMSFFSPSKPTNLDPAIGQISYSSILSNGDLIDFTVFLSQNDSDQLIWSQQGLTYDFNESNKIETQMEIPVTENILNGSITLIAHFTFHSSKDNKPHTVTKSRPLTKYTTKATPDTVNLLSGEIKTNSEKAEYMHWVPFIDIMVHHDTNVYPQLLPQLEKKIKVQNFNYYPIVDLSDFWVIKQNLVLINSTSETVPLKLTFSIVWLYKYILYTQFEESQRIGQDFGLHKEGEHDLMKKMFLETNPYFLGLTMLVSMVHMIFEFMAFKSEIEFWKGRENLKGLSTNLLLYNFIASIVIFLYLLDTGEASWAVWLPMGLGIMIELWKITKGFDVSLSRAWPYISVKGKEAHKEGGTSQLDNTATKYLAYCLVPIMIIYSIYGVYAYEYKSWYSWLIGSLASLIYTCGFIMMTPQLYINYKLKSVAHMPWKVLTYKAINTFIDDMFAFIIAMPTMHRLACFRDDIIFIIYIYQKWIYKVDPNRHYLDTQADAPPTPEVSTPEIPQIATKEERKEKKDN